MSDELIDEMFFLAALVSGVYLWGVFVAQAKWREFDNIRCMLKKKEYSEYCNKTGMVNYFLKYAFLLEHLPYIHPYIAVLVPMSIIGAFFIFKNLG